MVSSKKVKFFLKQISKIAAQNFILPVVYRYFCLCNKMETGKIIFADAHHTELPSSMRQLYFACVERGNSPECCLQDYSELSAVQLFKTMVHFMDLYSKAQYIVICDNFLPVASCRKRKGTVVIQLWHGAGALKKFGYDSDGDIPSWYLGNVFKNYDIVTVSSKACVKPFASAMRLPENLVRPLGISRTDSYFNREYLQQCKDQFYQKCPEMKGKKVLLWAPTFRGNLMNPFVPGQEEIEKLETMLGSEWKVMIKLHPHMKTAKKTAGDVFSAEELLPVIDFLITDYSSIIFDYLLFEKPFAFFVPDLEDYMAERGFYVSLDEFPGRQAKDAKQLYDAVTAEWRDAQRESVRICRERFMKACDGQATERILREIGL